MSSLEIRLHSRIEKEGPISFSDFMREALYDPVHGFYGAGRMRVGSGGDFITNVSIGPLFGKLLARQFAEIWTSLSQPKRWTLVEQGADRGQLALDVLSALQEHSPECFTATQLILVEPLSALQAIQAKTLDAFSDHVHWRTCVKDLPDFEGVFYANELLDAFPFARLRRRGSDWVEMRVQNEALGFGWTEVSWLPERPTFQNILPLLPPVPDGFCVELSEEIQPWLSTILSKLKTGWLLVLDYGMTAEEFGMPHRANGTLSAYARHQRVDNPLANPGENDLTAHVNFTMLAKLASECGWRLGAYGDQSRFFTGLAPLHFSDAEAALSPAATRERLAFRSLTDPNLMGSRFKVLAMSNVTPNLPTLSGLRFLGSVQKTLGL